MNRAIILAALLATPAMADELVKPTRNGEIVLESHLCQGYKNMQSAYAYTERSFTEGCWFKSGDKIYIDWSRKRKVYSVNEFTRRVK